MGATQSGPAPGPSMPPCKGGQEAMQSGPGDACPIPPEHRQRPVYNVYNQRIDERPAGSLQQSYSATLDPKNNMPAVANQMPAPGQRDVLSTHRQQSNIPKGGTDATWLYPSPQMFYNALNRKGKSDGINEEDNVGGVMNSVVATHNSMNEMTWDRVMLWERLHPETTSTTQLNRFIGRPHDLSPLARLRTLRGLAAPFDRHDWFVVREDDREVRYVIDFYFNEDRAGHSDAFEIVARPALDSFEGALDRVKMAVYVQCARWGVPCPITGDQGRVVQRPDVQQAES